MSEWVGRGFNDILYKCNRGLVFLVEGNSQAYHNLFYLPFHVPYLFIYISYKVLEFLGIFFFDILFEFLGYFCILLFDNIF